MDDNSTLTDLLKKTAGDFDPARAHVDLDQARKSGRRRRLLTHIAAPAGSALAVAAVAAGLFVAVPHGSSPAGTTPTGQPTASAAGNPVTTPAVFGWLPAGFSTLDFNDTSTVPPPSTIIAPVVAQAATPNADLSVLLTVISAKQAANTTGTVTAPDVNGKPARWETASGGLEWEYALGSWAVLIPGGLSSENWFRPGDHSAGPPLSPQGKADVLKIAARVQWGRHQVKFPYQFTHALPASWTLEPTMTGQYEDGTLVSTGMNLQSGPLASANGLVASPDTVLMITVQPFSRSASFCASPSTATGIQYIEADGVQWTYQTEDDQFFDANGHRVPTQSICAVGPLDGQSIRLTLVLDRATGATANTPIPGVAEIGPGGVKTILSWLKFLGPNPANWTTRPLAP
jgi:hypothetical protein